MAIAVSCASCGKQYKVGSENAGKKMRCKCGATLRVPAAKKKAAPKAAAPVDDDSLFSFEAAPGEGLAENYMGSGERPVRRKGGGFPVFRCIVVPLMALLILASIGMLTAVVYEVPAAVNVADKLHLHPEEWRGLVLAQPEIDNDVRYFPDNTQVVAVVNVKELLASQAYQQLEAEAKKAGIDLADWKKLGGELSLDDVQRISVGLRRDEGKAAIAVVRFNRAVTPDEIQEAPTLVNVLFGIGLVAEGKEFSLAGPEASKFERNEVGTQKHVVYDTDEFSFARIGDRGVAFGPKEVLHKALERKSRNRLSRRLQEELARAAPAASAFVWAMTAAAIPADTREQLEKLLGDDYVKKVEAMSVSLRVGQNISVNTTLYCRDEASAEVIAKEAGEKLNAVVRTPSWLKDVPKDLLQKTSVTAGRRYTASLSADADGAIKVGKIGMQAVARLFLKTIEDHDKPKDKEKNKEREPEKERPKEKGIEKGKETKDGQDKAPEKEKSKDKEKNDKEKVKDKDKKTEKE